VEIKYFGQFQLIFGESCELLEKIFLVMTVLTVLFMAVTVTVLPPRGLSRVMTTGDTT
jgi:hypothetical protein